MTIFVGGIRARLVRESLWNMINDGLTDLGWFDSGRQHLPVSFVAAPVNDDEAVALNTIALADGDINDIDIELGSLLAEHRWTFYVDIYAQNTALGVQLSHDVKGIVEGRMPSIGRSDPSFTLYDYRTATPVQFGFAQIENVMVDRGQNWPQPFRRFWYSVGFTVVDTYGDENDS